jgi:S1-C subfamily serine protease
MRQATTLIFLIIAGAIRSSMAIADPVSSGSGFAIGNGSAVITNFHVIEGCNNVNITNVGPGIIKVVDQRNDIAVIQSARPIAGALHFRTSGAAKLGEEIIVIGFPLRGLLSSGPTVTTGIVSSLAGLRDDRTRLQISAPIQPGNSGGPVLDRAGNVVGMVVSKLNVLRIARMTGDIPQNVNFGIPSSIITAVLDSYSLKYQGGAFDREKSIAEVVSAASPGVVGVECLGREQPAETIGVPAVPPRAVPVPTRGLGDYGAIAWDQGTGKYGWSWRQQTQTRADEVALSDCGATGCKIIMRSGRAMCAALATTGTGNYVGAARRGDREAALLAALSDCEKGKAGECTVRVTDCNK